MAGAAPRIVPPPGIAEAYDSASRQLADQLSQVDQLDSKLGAAIGLLTLGIGYLSAVGAPVWVRAVIGVLLFIALGSAMMGFFTGRGDYLSAPSPMASRRLAALPVDVAKTVLIENVVAAFESNQRHLRRKELHLKVTIVGLGLTLVFVVVLRAAGVF